MACSLKCSRLSRPQVERRAVREHLDAAPGDLGVLLAGAAADADGADDLTVDHDRHAPSRVVIFPPLADAAF